MPTITAQPYATEHVGFEFDSFEDFQEKADAHPCEEFELEFLDGTALERHIFSSAGIEPHNLHEYFEATGLEEFGQRQLTALLYVDMPLTEALEHYADVAISEHDSVADWAFETVDAMGGPAVLGEETLATYFDYERYGRDAELGGDIIEMDIAGTRSYVDAGSLER